MNKYQRKITAKFSPHEYGSFVIIDPDHRIQPVWEKSNNPACDIAGCIESLERNNISSKDYSIHECVNVNGKASVIIDIYDVLTAYEVTNPATAHAIKKLLMPGQRGAKSKIQDIDEAIASLFRAIELERAE